MEQYLYTAAGECYGYQPGIANLSEVERRQADTKFNELFERVNRACEQIGAKKERVTGEPQRAI